MGETTYSLRALPAGGYVRMAGMLGLEGEADAGERNFYRASIPKRLATILAGIVANMLFAGAAVHGHLHARPNASTCSPAPPPQLAGLHDGDVIVSVDGSPSATTPRPTSPPTCTPPPPRADGRPMTVVYTSGGATHTAAITPSLIVINGVQAPPAASPAPGHRHPRRRAPERSARSRRSRRAWSSWSQRSTAQPVPRRRPGPGARLGGSARPCRGFVINADGSRGAAYIEPRRPPGSATASGAAGAVQAAWRLGVTPNYDGRAGGPGARPTASARSPPSSTTTFTDLGNLVTNPKSGGITGPQGLSGPVGIVRQTVTATHQGGRSLAFWIAFISMNLGLVNVLPIPFLDGGKAVLILIEAVRRRRLDPRREALIYAVGTGDRGRLRDLCHHRRREQARMSSAITRRPTVPVNVGGVVVGGAAPIPVQTMTKTQTEDVAATLAQIERAAKAGADIIRVTCDTPEAGVAMREIVKGSPIPVIADVHYDAPLALRALEAGIACLRLNPGNITDPTKVRDIATEAAARNVPIRIGVNSGSIPQRKDLDRGRGLTIDETAEHMVEAALGHIRILEDLDFRNIKVSLKASDVLTNIAVNRQVRRARQPLPAAPRPHRGGPGGVGQRQERDGHRHPARRGHRRHHPRLAGR